MIGIDTNVLVRYIMQDDLKQSPLADRFIESLTVEAPGFIPLVALVEVAWVLTAAYDLKRSELVKALEGILRTKELITENANLVWRALHDFKAATADFADCLIASSATRAGCTKIVTFDRAATKSTGMILLA